MPANLYKVLSISGGGYRGYYSASVINCLESLGSTSINDKCDLFAGTSIGGIIAIGLAAGLSSTEIIDGFRAHGEEIFPESFRRNWMSWILCKYNSDKLRQAILRNLRRRLVQQANFNTTT